MLLVSPPDRETLADVAPAFARAAPDRAAALHGSGALAVAASDADPYNSHGARATHAEPLGAALHIEVARGHITPDDGYGPWPEVEQWCRSGRWPSGAGKCS